jgi:DNA-binding IclR family transcriptional regulator
VTEANTTYARFNDTVQLYYKATDNLSPQVTSVAVVVKNARGLTVATITVSAPQERQHLVQRHVDAQS